MEISCKAEFIFKQKLKNVCPDQDVIFLGSVSCHVDESGLFPANLRTLAAHSLSLPLSTSFFEAKYSFSSSTAWLFWLPVGQLELRVTGNPI